MTPSEKRTDTLFRGTLPFGGLGAIVHGISLASPALAWMAGGVFSVILFVIYANLAPGDDR